LKFLNELGEEEKNNREMRVPAFLACGRGRKKGGRRGSGYLFESGGHERKERKKKDCVHQNNYSRGGEKGEERIKGSGLRLRTLATQKKEACSPRLRRRKKVEKKEKKNRSATL